MAKRKLTPEELRIRKRKLMIRRIIFFSVCVVLLVLIISLLVFLVKAIFSNKNTLKPADFAQIGPEVVVAPYEIVEYTNSYKYNEAVPEMQAVDKSYFSTALFLGDSRTLGLSMYTKTGAKTLASSNVSVDTAWNFKYGDANELLPDVLAATVYSSIYISFGLNELGWPYFDSFIDAYSKLINNILETQPNAMIYVQSIIPVSANQSASSKTFTNERIELYNEQLLKMCAKKKVYFVDLNAAYKDAAGVLPSEFTSDGINLKMDCFDKWINYLTTHTVKKELYTN